TTWFVPASGTCMLAQLVPSQCRAAGTVSAAKCTPTAQTSVGDIAATPYKSESSTGTSDRVQEAPFQWPMIGIERSTSDPTAQTSVTDIPEAACSLPGPSAEAGTIFHVLHDCVDREPAAATWLTRPTRRQHTSAPTLAARCPRSE